MLISELMSLEPESVAAEATVQSAAQTMAELDLDALPVKSEGRVVGLLTDRDILIRVVAAGRPLDIPVAEVMSTELVSCQASDDASAVERVMRERQIRRMPVVDEAGALAGWIELDAIAAAPPHPASGFGP